MESKYLTYASSSVLYLPVLSFSLHLTASVQCSARLNGMRVMSVDLFDRHCLLLFVVLRTRALWMDGLSGLVCSWEATWLFTHFLVVLYGECVHIIRAAELTRTSLRYCASVIGALRRVKSVLVMGSLVCFGNLKDGEAARCLRN